MNSILDELGAKPSISEEHGLALLSKTDLNVFSPGISTAGFAEIRMAKQNKERKIVATTIDDKGLDFANEVIKQMGLGSQIETRNEDLRSSDYPENYFDFIYARLVLHYLSYSDLDNVLSMFYKSLKNNGRVFVVVRSIKNVDYNDPNITFDSNTKLTTIYYRNKEGQVDGNSVRYFHTPKSMSEH